MNLKALTPSSHVFIQQTGIFQPAEVCWALEQVHRVEILQPTNVFSPGTPSPVPSPVHLQSGPPRTWVPMLGHQDTGQALPLGEKNCRNCPSLQADTALQRASVGVQRWLHFSPYLPTQHNTFAKCITYTTVFSSPVCATGVA